MPQVPAIGNLNQADLVAFVIWAGSLIVIMLIPFIPGLRRIPYVIPVYKIIWRDWYEKYPSGDPSKSANK